MEHNNTSKNYLCRTGVEREGGGDYRNALMSETYRAHSVVSHRVCWERYDVASCGAVYRCCYLLLLICTFGILFVFLVCNFAIKLVVFEAVRWLLAGSCVFGAV